MASLCLQFPVDCYKPGPTRPDHKGDPFPSRLGVDPQLEKLAAPPGSRLPHLAAWTEDFLASGKGMPDDEFLQIYKVFAKLYPKEAQVPLEYMEEFEQKHAADRPEIWQIQKARDVVPPPPPDPPAPSPPPSGSPSEPAASTAKVTNDPAGLHVLLGSPPPSPPPSPPGGSDSEEDDQREAAAEERNAVSDMAKSAAKPLDQRKREREDQRNKAARKEARQSQAMLKPQRAVAASWAKKPQAAAGAAGAAAAGAAGEAAAGAAEATEPEAGEEPAAAADEAGFRAEVDRLKAELCAATAEIERLKAENETLKAEKRARESVEAALPEGTTWTFAEQYVLQPGTESLVGLVGEKLEAMTGAPVVCVVGTPKPSLIVHHPGRGYVSDHEQVGSLLQQLLAAVRRAVAAVEVDEDVQEELDQTMRGNLEKVRTLAGKITESDVSKALISHLRLNPANVLTLDTQRGILNLVGDQIATYDRETCTVALVDRDPDRHLVSRTTGVDCAWLKPELGQSQQDVYSEFKSTKLNRWIIDPEARQYVLCAAGSALFGGDTTNIKSSLLVIGGPDQGKTALLNAIVAAGGWQPASAGSVNTSGCYSFSGANPQSLRGKASVGTARSGVLDIGDGLRLLAFNELESGDVWAGVKTLATRWPSLPS